MRTNSTALFVDSLSHPDKLVLGFIALIIVVTALLHPAPTLPITLLFLQGAAVLGFARAGMHSRLGRHVHAFAPIVLVIVLFETIGPIIATVQSARFDAFFAKADVKLFGNLPDAWRGFLGRPSWLTDLASVAYVSFYVMPPLVALLLYLGKRDRFDAFATKIVATFMLSYIGYFLWPAYGPRVPVELENEQLGGGVISEWVRWFIRSLEHTRLDAFPSGHLAAALATVVQAWRPLPRLRVPLVAMAAGITFSTVYLSYHYIVDLLAGVVLGLVGPVLAIALCRSRVMGGVGPDAGFAGHETP